MSDEMFDNTVMFWEREWRKVRRWFRKDACNWMIDNIGEIITGCAILMLLVISIILGAFLDEKLI